MTEIEKLQQQVQDLKKQLAGQAATNATLKKKAFGAVVQGHPFKGQDSRTLSLEQLQLYADQSSRVKSNFLENVSHEIRSSMNGIVGMTSLVLSTDLSREQREYLGMVNTSVDRLLGVVNQILDYSKIESGQLDLKMEDFSLRESLDHELYLLQLSAQKKGLGLSCQIDSDVPAYIHGDPQRLVQIVSSLVDNGIKFTTSGSVEIRIENDGYDSSNNLILKFLVIDTGCGIVETTQELISHFFKQQASHHVPQLLIVGSAGLGLTVVSQLVKIMGGDIGFESDHSGSVFWFTLPVKEAVDFYTAEERGNRAFENIEEKTTYALKGARVLLAEDEYINRVLIETILKQLDMEITCVESGDRAVEEACQNQYDVVLMDVQMEQMDGLEATRKIRDHEKKSGGHLPVIALTARVMPGDREKCLQAGMDDYLPKPVEKDHIVDVLNKYLTSRALVVVSEVENQQLLVRTLVEHGWQVTIAETSRTALYEVSLSHFDLIIFDITMAENECLAAVETVRQLEEFSGQRAVIVGMGEKADREKYLTYGIDGYIDGPLTSEKIRTQLDITPVDS